MKETLTGLNKMNRKGFYYHVGMSEDKYNYYVNSCETDVRDSEFAKVAKYEAITVNAELPELTGTEKQIAWAEDIRRRQLADIVEAVYNKVSEWTTEAKDQLMAEANVTTISEFVNMMFAMQATGILNETSAKKIIETR
jgi:hypothetical protein